MVVVYLLLVELAKTWFYRTAQPPRPPRPGSTHAQWRERRILRRASRFIRHPAVQEPAGS
jgi:hypothetical protein